jgi:hypothetical protein
VKEERVSITARRHLPDYEATLERIRGSRKRPRAGEE